MVLKTPPAFAICSTNNVLNLFAIPAHHQSITSPPRHTTTTPSQRRTSRSYATVHSPNDGPGQKPPPPWPTCANPTPYDIFAIDKSAPYTKARFAELVKQYHPDKHHAAALDALPPQTRLDRYRLVVLANDILSSPDKRRAYDSWGAGWHTSAEDPRDINEIYRQADKAWRNNPGNPAMNATWEDWERWHDRRNNGEKQSPVFMSNASFAALVLAALAVGTVAQTTRMDNNSAYIMDKRHAYEANISEALRRQNAATAGKGREERIERFLRDRENINFEFQPSKFDPPK
ncbi:J domain-containing protein 1 [Colletotrichum chlorophyti]|uniref:J domain-containing protein 1 n=1 Tax=Colletotrichum chlorophyti TaxID=708187 RepID=A0A1Q8RXD9_9PEZI|nr:J domain-containing protein 1 [Colletotrichum chlorophyti]